MSKQWTPPAGDTPVDNSTWQPPATDTEVAPKKASGAGSPHDFGMGYPPTSQDIQQRQKLNNLENSFDKIQNTPAPKQDKGSWGNFGDFAPAEIFSGLEKDMGNLFTFAKDKIAKAGWNNAATGLDNISDFWHQAQKKDEAISAANPLPNTTTGHLATGVTKFVPDILELALAPQADLAKLPKLGEYAAKLGKVGTKAAQMAVGKFPIQQATKNMLQSYSDAKDNGTDPDVAAIKGFGEGYKNGYIFEGLGKGAGKLTELGKGALEKAGLMAGNKFVAGAEKKLLNSAAQGVAFSAAPVLQNAVEGKSTSMDEIKDNALFGAVLGAVHGGGGEHTDADKAAAQIIMRKPLIDLHNFVNADAEDIKNIHNSDATAPDLQAQSAAHAEQGFKADNPEEKNKEVLQSSLTGKASSIKSVTDAIMNDKDGVIGEVNQMDLPDEAKKAAIDKVNQTYRQLDPIEQQKSALADQITALEETPTNGIIEQKENAVKVKALNKQLDEIITNQHDQQQDRASGKRVTYSKGTSEDDGKYFKTIDGKPEEITQSRYELEKPPKNQQNESTNEKMGEQPEEQVTGQGRNESDGSQESNAKENGQEEVTPTTGGDEPPVEPTKGEPQDAVQKQSPGEVGVREQGTVRKEVGKDDGSKVIAEKSKEEGSPKRQKAIDSVTHGIVYSPDEKFDGYSPRFDFGMSKIEKDKAVSDIKKGNFDTAPAKKMLDKLQEWDKNDSYPVIEGNGGHTERVRDATAGEIQQHIDDAKAHKLGELTPSQIEEVNKSLKELGFTHQDFVDYENSRTETEHPATRATESTPSDVQQPENDTTTGSAQNTSGEPVQGAQKHLTSTEQARKLELRKKFAGKFNSGVNPLDKELYEYAGLVFKEAKGEFKAWAKTLIEDLGEKIRPHLAELWKKSGGDEKDIPQEESAKEVKKTILTKRAYEGEIQDDVKKYLEEKGLKRKSFSQEERSRQATDFINEFGEDAAYRAVESGDVDGGMAASILAQLQIRNSRAMEGLPEGSDDREELAKKQSYYIALMEKKGYLGGEFNGQLAHEYQNAELDYANVKKQVEANTGKPLSAEQENKVKQITAENEQLKAKLKEAESKLIEETDKVFKVDTTADKGETKTQKAKRIADKLRSSAKIHRPGVFSSATLASIIWDGAIEVTAKSIELGGKLTDAIEAGLKHIRDSDWYKGLSANKQSEAEREFSKFNYDSSSSTDLADLQSRFVDKKGNKFTPEEAKSIWGYMKEKYLDNGTSYKDALSKTAQDLGLSWRQISEAITTPKVKRMSDEMWKHQSELARHRSAIKNWIADQNKSVAGKALQKISGIFRGTAVFGHGGIFIGTHAGMTLFNPSMWNKTIPAFFRGWKFAYGNEGDYQRGMEELKNSPNYLIAERAGLKNNPERINNEEYQRSQKFLGKLGLAGERGFNAIKVLRQDIFDYHFNKLTPAERDDPAVAKSISHLVNLATGATTLKIPAWVNEASFAGGMEASRWEKLTANPVKATQVALNAILASDKASVADRIFAKVWARRVGEQLATFGGALLANAAIQNTLNPNNSVNYTDPSKPDFLKFKFGDVTIDPTSGMRSAAMFMYGLGKIPFQDKKELHGEKRIKVLGKNVAQYARGKLAPFYGTAADFFTSQDYNGNTMPYSNDEPSGKNHRLSWTEYGLSKVPLPIAEAVNVAYESANEHGADKSMLNHIMKGVMSGVISGSTGFRVGEYDADAPKNDPLFGKLSTVKNDDGDKIELTPEQFKQRKEIYTKAIEDNKKEWTNDFDEDWNDDKATEKRDQQNYKWHIIGRSDKWIKEQNKQAYQEKLDQYIEKQAAEQSAQELNIDLSASEDKKTYPIKN